MKSTNLLRILVLCVVLSISSSCCIMGKNPVLKGTKWTAVQEMFVADAGTMTINHTLEFLSAKKVLVKEEGSMPPYPAMYMNPDGTVDTMPGHSTPDEDAGTYTLSDGILTITNEEGGAPTRYLLQADGTIALPEPWGETLVFTRVEEKEK